MDGRGGIVKGGESVAKTQHIVIFLGQENTTCCVSQAIGMLLKSQDREKSNQSGIETLNIMELMRSCVLVAMFMATSTQHAVWNLCEELGQKHDAKSRDSESYSRNSAAEEIPDKARNDLAHTHRRDRTAAHHTALQDESHEQVRVLFHKRPKQLRLKSHRAAGTTSARPPAFGRAFFVLSMATDSIDGHGFDRRKPSLARRAPRPAALFARVTRLAAHAHKLHLCLSPSAPSLARWVNGADLALLGHQRRLT